MTKTDLYRRAAQRRDAALQRWFRDPLSDLKQKRYNLAVDACNHIARSRRP